MLKSFFLALVVLLTVAGAEVAAQTENPEKVEYSNYVTSLDDYQKTHADYELARSQYLKFETLKSKTDAQNSTLKMLEARDAVIVDYLSLLKSKIENLKGVDSSSVESAVSILGDEISWYSNHKSKLSSSLSLEDLLVDSKDAEDHFVYTQKLYFYCLSLISDGAVGKSVDKFMSLSQKLKEKLQIIKDDKREEYLLGLEKTQLIDRWIFESDARIERIDGKRKDAVALALKILNLKASGEPEKAYSKITPILEEAKQYLVEANSYLSEVIKEIKIAN